ncbi:MAG: excinuclease ABC subunit UvrC [Chlamydiales bacterium]|nr:excinuclease ABC subunit UvrC [Chlamydiales bacterium]
MFDEREKVLYVGKAKNLRRRIKQYFVPGRDGRMMVPFLTAKVKKVDTIVVTSEKEALLLENTLIKEHQPKYNALLKDDKTFFSIMINNKHKWPMLRVVRFKGGAPKNHLYFGPYTDAFAARKTLALLRQLFQLRQCSDHELAARSRPCILYEMKQCLAPCVNKCTQEEYDCQVNQVVNFLRGKDKAIHKQLEQERKEASEQLDFERAGRAHDLLEAIEKTLEKQRVQKAGQKDLDALGLFRLGDHVVLTQMVFRGGKLMASHDHHFRKTAQEDEEIVRSFLMQHYEGMPEMPHKILLPFKIPYLSVLEIVLNTEIVIPERGNKRALVKMAETNAQAKLKQEKSACETREQVLMQMQERLHLTNFPGTIECFDNSNISGSEPVSARVLFDGGEPNKSGYRKYKIKEAASNDDYGQLKEVLTRRFQKADLPDLLMIDGGKGHLKVALRTLSELDISTIDVIAVAKEKGRHDKGVTEEQIFLPGRKEPIVLRANSPVLFLLQRVRDEAHRFAIGYQKERRKKRTFESELDSLEGIGPIKKKRLLTHFGSVTRLRNATPEQWSEVQGITKHDIETLKLWTEKKGN